MPKKPIVEPPPLRTYGCPVQGATQLFCDRWAYSWRVPIDQGAPRRIELFKSISDNLAPGWLEWHPWTHRAIEGLCENKWIALAGCAGSAKTRNVVGFACTWWLANPEESSVIFCSTTAKALRKRGWAQVQSYHSTLHAKHPLSRVGNFVDSRMMWQATKGDDLNAITGIAVEEGEMTKIADNIKGVHTRRQLVIIDEATAVPPAIFEACTNLYATPREFILVMIGNPRSRLDQFGVFMEPLKGWDSVTVDSEEWETTPKIDGSTGICIRFDVEKSPNLDYPEDKPISRFIPSRAHVDRVRSNTAYHDNPSYWSNERGFPPPDGLNKTVFSETAIAVHDGRGKHRFTGEDFNLIGSFDHARNGGDRPTLRFAAMGEIDSGKFGIELMPPIIIPIKASSNNPIDYQIVEQIRREAENVNYRGQRMHCDPKNIGFDATGGGADLCDIAQRTWSPDVIRILFSDAATADACSHEDVRPANTVFRNLRAEMYSRAASALDADQLKGIDWETEKELVSLEFNDDKALRTMISKRDYKLKFKKSPDFADTVAMLVEVGRRRGFRLAVRGNTVKLRNDIQKTVTKTQQVFDEIVYAADNEDTENDFEPMYAGGFD
jgi:hypothetical protein